MVLEGFIQETGGEMSLCLSFEPRELQYQLAWQDMPTGVIEA